MVGGKVFSYPENWRALKVLILAKYGGHDVKLDESFQFGTTNLSPAFLSKFPLGKVPCVELSTGKLLDETNSAAWQLCPEQMTGGQDKEVQAEVIRWMTVSDVEVTPAACNWVYPVIGILQHTPDMQRGRQDLLKLLTVVNSELRLKTWMVGERISLADISMACSLLLVFTHVMDQDIRDRLPHLTRWFNTVVNQKMVKEVLDKVDLTRKAEGKPCLDLVYLPLFFMNIFISLPTLVSFLNNLRDFRFLSYCFVLSFQSAFKTAWLSLYFYLFYLFHQVKTFYPFRTSQSCCGYG